MKSLLFTLTFFFTFLSNVVNAASLDERISACLEGTISPDEAAVLAIELFELKRVFSDYVMNNAAVCFTKISGEPSVFENGVGLTTDPDAIESVNEYRERENEAIRRAAVAQEVFEAELSEKAKNAPLLRENSKCELLKLRQANLDQQAPFLETLIAFDNLIEARQQEAVLETVIECNNWANQDRRAAMTNPVCHGIFLETGLSDSKIEGPSLLMVSRARSNSLSLGADLMLLDKRLQAIRKEELLLLTLSERDLLLRKNMEAKEASDAQSSLANRRVKSNCEQAWDGWLAK